MPLSTGMPLRDTEPLPNVRWLVALGWLAYCLVNAAIWHAAYTPIVSLRAATLVFGAWTICWILATPVIGRVAGAWVRHRMSRTAAIGALAATCIAMVLLLSLVRAAMAPALFGPSDVHFADQVLRLVARWGDLHVATFIAIAGIAHAWQHTRHDLESERQIRAVEASLARQRRDFLQSQLRPHFLFNVLNSIAEDAHANRSRAQDTLARLEMLLRGVSAMHHRALVPLREELAVLEPYLELQRTRFEERLVIETAVAPDAMEWPVPLLVVQPLVENAINHGASRAAGTGHVRITADVVDGDLELLISDNGPGFDVSRPSDGIGLRNTVDRLHDWFGSQAALTYGANANGGAVVRVVIPALDGERAMHITGAHAVPRPAPLEETPELATAMRLEWRREWRRLVGQLLIAWPLWGAMTFALTALFASRIARPIEHGIFIPVLTAMLLMALTPALVALAMWLQDQPRRIAIPLHILAGSAVAYFGMRIPLSAAGFPHLDVFGTRTLNTVAQNALLYSLVVIAVGIERVSARARQAATARADAETGLAAVQWQSMLDALRPETLLAELARLRNLLASDPGGFHAALGQVVRQLRTALDVIARNRVGIGAELEALARIAPAIGVRLQVAVPDEVWHVPIPVGTLRRQARDLLLANRYRGRGLTVCIAAVADHDGGRLSGVDIVLEIESRRPWIAPGKLSGGDGTLTALVPREPVVPVTRDSTVEQVAVSPERVQLRVTLATATSPALAPGRALPA